MSKVKEILHIYIRVSTKGQSEKGTSLKHQRKLGIKKAKDLGMDYEVYDEENARSSFDNFANRPQLTKLLKLVDEGKVKNVYVWNNDRLSRNIVTFGMMRQKFLENKVNLYTEYGKYDFSNREENYVFGILAETSVLENELRRERLMEGRKAKAIKGFWFGGEVLFGYKCDKNKRLVLDEKQSIWVKRIFEWYGNDNLSIKDIKKRLDGEIETNRGNLFWSFGSIEKLLKNTHHYGEYEIYGVKIKIPPIISKELWDKCEKRRLKNKRYSIKGDDSWKDNNENIRDLLRCGCCKNKLGGRKRKYKGKDKKVYVCVEFDRKYKRYGEDISGNWKRGKYCENNRSMDKERVEDGLFEVLSEVMKNSHTIKEEFKTQSLSNKYKSEKEKNNEIKSLKRKKKGLERDIKEVEDKIVEKEVEKVGSRSKAKLINKTLNLLQIKYEEINTEIKLIDIKLTSLQSENVWIDWVSDYEEWIENNNKLSRSKKIELIRKYIKEVDVILDKNTQQHQFNIKFKLKLINESLNYFNPNRKSEGYEIKEGLNNLHTNFNL